LNEINLKCCTHLCDCARDGVGLGLECGGCGRGAVERGQLCEAQQRAQQARQVGVEKEWERREKRGAAAL